MAEGEKKFPIVIIIGMLVFGLALAGGMSYFIATKIVADKAGSQGGEKKVSHDPGELIRLGDAKEGMIINVGGVNSGRFLKVGMILEVRPNKKEEKAEGKMPSRDEILIMDTVVHVMRSQKIEDFEPQKQEQLKEMIKNTLNKAFGEDKVYEVYITNLVLQ